MSEGAYIKLDTKSLARNHLCIGSARLSLCHKTQSRALDQMAYGAQCDKLMRTANALMGLVISIFTWQCRIPRFEMLAQMAIVCYVSQQRKAMTSLQFCTGSPEP